MIASRCSCLLGLLALLAVPAAAASDQERAALQTELREWGLRLDLSGGLATELVDSRSPGISGLAQIVLGQLDELQRTLAEARGALERGASAESQTLLSSLRAAFDKLEGALLDVVPGRKKKAYRRSKQRQMQALRGALGLAPHGATSGARPGRRPSSPAERDKGLDERERFETGLLTQAVRLQFLEELARRLADGELFATSPARDMAGRELKGNLARAAKRLSIAGASRDALDDDAKSELREAEDALNHAERILQQCNEWQGQRYAKRTEEAVQAALAARDPADHRATRRVLEALKNLGLKEEVRRLESTMRMAVHAHTSLEPGKYAFSAHERGKTSEIRLTVKSPRDGKEHPPLIYRASRGKVEIVDEESSLLRRIFRPLLGGGGKQTLEVQHTRIDRRYLVHQDGRAKRLESAGEGLVARGRAFGRRLWLGLRGRLGSRLARRRLARPRSD